MKVRRRFSQSLIIRDENLADSTRFEGCEGSCGPWLREWFCFLPGGGLYDQGVKFDTVETCSCSYDAFRFLEARFGGDVGEAQFVYCGIGPREAGWWAYEVQVGM